jgi:putative membrane protein insertion efficiency factor
LLSSYILFCLLVCNVNAFGQIFSESDSQLIKSKTFNTKAFNERDVRFGFKKGVTITNILLAVPLYVYQKTLSSQISASCLYHPTCSEFSHQAFSHYGFFKAFFSTVDRVMRCDRLSATDIPKISISVEDQKKIEGIDYYSSFHIHD